MMFPFSSQLPEMFCHFFLLIFFFSLENRYFLGKKTPTVHLKSQGFLSKDLGIFYYSSPQSVRSFSGFKTLDFYKGFLVKIHTVRWGCLFLKNPEVLYKRRTVRCHYCVQSMLIANESRFIHIRHFLKCNFISSILADCQGGSEIFKEKDPFHQMLQNSL